MAAFDQLARARRCQTDAVLVDLDLLRDTDAHALLQARVWIGAAAAGTAVVWAAAGEGLQSTAANRAAIVSINVFIVREAVAILDRRIPYAARTMN